MLLPPQEITSDTRPGSNMLPGMPPEPPKRDGGLLPAVLVTNAGPSPGPPPPPPPKPKPTQYDFRYEDSDTLMQEINEFYSYSEMDDLSRKRGAFEQAFGSSDWVSSSASSKETYLRSAIEELASEDSSKRVAAAQALCYVLSGSWKESMGPEHQLHLLTTNSTLLRSVGGLQLLLDYLASVAQSHSTLHSKMDDHFDDHSHSPSEEIELLDMELSLALEMIFLVIEVGRGDETLSAELMQRDPPTLVFLMRIIASLKDTLKERALQTFPLKKLLLVTWKVLLASLGGLRTAQKVADLNRELDDLPTPKSDWQGFAKSSAADIARFRTEMSTKYPTFDPTLTPTPPELTHHLPRPEKLAEAIAPIPVRPHYHAPLRDATEDVFTSLFHSAHPPSSSSHDSGPMPLTPAPSPQPSPQMKPKKEKWQTDPLRPFIFPFSSAMGGRTIPAAIKEADDLFKRHMYVPLGVWQLWKEREEFIKEDMGVPALSLEDDGAATTKADSERAGRIEAIEKEAELAKEDSDFKAAKLAAERQSHLRKLQHVETIYKGVLSSILPSTVVVLLKQILATLPAQPPAGAQPGNPGFNSTAIASPSDRVDGMDAMEFNDEAKKPEPTVAEVDSIREKEIISKSGSAIILLLMKWFKSNHVLKFQHLSQLLLDMNCPLIMVKTFLLQDPVDLVQAKNEVEDKNFFRFCMLHHSSHPPPRGPEDFLTVAPPRLVPRRAVSPSGHPGAPDDEEVELLSDYSWRNFFSAVNRIKIIQKLLKGRTHQIHQFNQYKTFNTFKRMLKVQHPMFQLQVLKIIKAQIPHYGKKWKQQNMKIVTAIYLNCRPDLRDEWLVSVMEKDELEESNLQEQALRSLVRFYHNKHYSHLLSTPHSHHSRTGSTTGPYFHPNGSHASQSHSDGPSHSHAHHRHSSASGADDIFPPNRTRRVSSSSSPGRPGASDDFGDAWQHEYEDVLEDVFGSTDDDSAGLYGSLSSWGPLAGALANLSSEGDGWLFGDGDDFSDVSSIGSIGELGGRARLNDGEGGSEEEEEEDEGPTRSPVDEVEAEDADEEKDTDAVDANRNSWEHLSALTNSPIQQARRRSSGGSPLRPVMKGNGIDEMTDEIEELEELGPIKKEASDGPAVDEVEAMYGE